MDKKQKALEEYQRLIGDWMAGAYCLRELDEKISYINEKYETKFELVIKKD
jgi:hypothetical protein